MTKPRALAQSAAAALLAALACCLPPGLGAQTSHPAPIGATPAGRIEAGATDFTVLGPEVLGMSAPPTDLHELPNGVLLAVAQDEISLGDGVRWQSYPRAADAPALQLTQVAVAADGTIYAGMEGGFARIELTEQGRWRPVRVADFPDEPALHGRILSRVQEVAGDWYWHDLSGSLVSWRPGKPVRLLGQVNGFECVFATGGGVFASDASSASVFRIGEKGLERVSFWPEDRLGELITASTPWKGTSTLLGTNARGVLVLEADGARPLGATALLGGRYRINDLCPLPEGHVAAAVDSIGVVFFDRAGRITLSMDRSLDHRLARARRLIPGQAGAVWALLGQGIARFGYPTQLTDFETKVGSGLAFSLLYRHMDTLWLATDGLAQRAVHDPDGRLLEFQADTPPGYVMSLFSNRDLLLAGTDRGIYRRTDTGWVLDVPGINKPHICPTPDPDGRWLYAAIDEVGWLRRTPAGIVAERHPWPGLGATFLGIERVGRDYWVELGSARVARIRGSPGGSPEIRIFSVQDGLLNSWAQIFILDGVVRLNLSGHVMRYDPAGDRFLPDPDFPALAAGVAAEHGRPARDSLGRLWMSTHTGVMYVTQPGNGAAPEKHLVTTGIQPISFTMQADGVVWMHQRQRLLRFDPAQPGAPAMPLRALISSVQLPGSNRCLQVTGDRLPDLEYSDNSLTLSLLAPGASPSLGVSFEVLLEGGGGTWEPVGASGTTSFSRLKEGRYVVHVRPRTAAGTGAETTLLFSVETPWFRSWAAYAVYAFTAIGAIVSAVLGWTLLERRKQRELAQLVELRTHALRHSEERYRLLSQELEQRVTARTTALENANHELALANKELESFSYSVSHDLRAPLRGIDGWSLALLEDYGSKLDATAQEYLGRVRRETQRLGNLIDDLLKLARTTRAELKPAPLNLSEVADTAARQLAENHSGPRVEFHCQPGVVVKADAALMEVVLFNLLDNAWKFTAKTAHPRVEFGFAANTTQGPACYVRDNGAGFDMRHARKLFGAFQRMHAQGDFPGTGVGLATVQRIIHRHAGRVWADSTPGVQTTFYFSLPSIEIT